MNSFPETHYASAEDLHVAYQVVGDGPLDLIYVPRFASPIDLMWHWPDYARFLRRLASFSRLICFDKRASGRSDRGRDPNVATLEGWLEDITMVMDSAGSDRAALLGLDVGALLAMLFAATNPGRTSALVLWGATARGLSAGWGFRADDVEERLASFNRDWGTGAQLDQLAPSVSTDPRLRTWWAQYERAGNSPDPGTDVSRMLFRSDVRHVLPAIRVPTLVLHRTDDRFIRVEQGRHIAEHIPGARYMELPGKDHLPWVGDQDTVVDEMEAFLTGVRPAAESDRVLATVLFTDIVSSTPRATMVGDRRWSRILDRHDEVVLRELERYRGRRVKGTGDGFLATFDGPARAIRCAAAIQREVGDLDLKIRAGLHVGEIELRGEDIAGVAVVIARRVCDVASGGKLLVSRTVTDLVAGSGLEFDDQGEHELKGVPGRWQLFAVRA